MGWDGVLFSSSLQKSWGWSSEQPWLQQRAEQLAAVPSAYAGSRPPGQ